MIKLINIIIPQDKIYGRVLEDMKNHKNLELWKDRNNYSLKNYTLKYKGKLIVLIKKRQNEIVYQFYNNLVGSHNGVQKTLNKIKNIYYQYGMRKLVHKQIKKYYACNVQKDNNYQSSEKLQFLQEAYHLQGFLTMNFIPYLPKVQNKDSFLVVVDRLTKFTIFIFCSKKIRSSKTADLLIKEIFYQYGCLDEIISDKGPQFMSRFQRKIIELLEVKFCLSSAHHPNK